MVLAVVVLGVCALGACHQGESEPIRLPNGKLGHLIECEADCFRRAGRTCKRGYEIMAARMIVDEGGPNFASGVVYSALGSQPVSRPPSVRGYNWIIQCRRQAAPPAGG